MAIRLFYGNALAESVGAEHGVARAEIDGLKPRAKGIRAALKKMRANGEIGFYDLPYDRQGAAASKKLAKHVRQGFENFVLLGIGGSALGPICVHTALAHPYHNLLDKKARQGAPRMFFLDNADPEWVGRLAEAVDLKKTFFSVVSKSGSTPETLAQLMVFHQAAAKAVGARSVDRHFAATTDPVAGPLRALAVQRGWPALDLPANVGGRFTALTTVGLFPAAVEGIAPEKLLAGAAAMEKRCRAEDLWKNPAELFAAIHFLADKRKGKMIAVMMPYSSALRDLADWQRQLWAESLGKAKALSGAGVHVGQTPVKALGATDQHSQVQLYAEGPNNKIFTFISVNRFRRVCPIPRSLPEIGELNYLAGHDMGKLLNEELNATEFALGKAKRPSVRFQLDAITPENLGGMFFVLEAATAVAGGLYNIDPFDQPGVEEGKRATAALMGRKRPEDAAKRVEIAASRKKVGTKNAV
ncbi:MAG: glucose-6-phosphate isomerase [Candidatus Sumerlaeota bacterium]|nr:glucose-6-phosphate isomerase [Candidatus Sumerlaeota bacterium]